MKHPLSNNSLFWLNPAHFARIAATDTNAYRLCSSPGGWAERLGDDALVCFKSDAARDELAAGLAERAAEYGWAPSRIFAKFLPRQNEDRISPVLLQGNPSLPVTTTVREAGTVYGLDFSAGYSHGLFLDQRANRALARRLAPKRLLNTFAYTCSFSVVAGMAGGETLSVDLSRKSLDRGKANFELNAIATEGRHRFIADDVLEVLPRLARRGDKFDMIILDPPTFSRGNQGRRWQVEQHFEDLLLAALEIAERDARILLSTNCTKLDSRALEQMGRFCLKALRRGGDFHREPALPDFPAGHGASTVWLTLR